MDKLSRKKSVAIIGLGYVGLPLALLTSSKGYDVIGIDITKEKVDLINKRIVPFVDEKLNSQIINFKNFISNNPNEGHYRF